MTLRGIRRRRDRSGIYSSFLLFLSFLPSAKPLARLDIMATLPITSLESATSGQTPERQPALSKRSPIAISTADVSSFSSNHDFTPSQLPSPTSPNTKMTTESQEESGFELVNGNIKLFETEKVITEKNYVSLCLSAASVTDWC